MEDHEEARLMGVMTGQARLPTIMAGVLGLVFEIADEVRVSI